MKQPESSGHTDAWAREKTAQPNLPKEVPHYTWLRSIFVAVILILIIGGAAIILGRNKQRPADWVYINALNGKQNVQLPDGSKVILRKGSSVSYPADYGKDSRNLKVKGEAFFEVFYNPSVPMSINNIKGITTDRGTSFMIRSNDSVEVLLVSNGRVKFESMDTKGAFVVLDSGQKAQIAGKEIITSPAGENNFLSWTNERLVFNRTPLNQVASDLNHFYGVPIRIAPDIDSEQIFITARFDNQPLTQIVQDISIIAGLSVTDEADGVMLSKPVIAAPKVQNDPAYRKKDGLVPVVKQQQKPAAETPKSLKNRKKQWWRFWN